VARGALGCTVVVAALAWAIAPPRAHGAPLGLDECVAVQGSWSCSGLVETWDGVPLDATVTLPHTDARNLPLVVLVHGFGNSKHEYLDPASAAYTGNAFEWARDGYAVLTFTARGLWGSCGTPAARLANPDACARGYIHLADIRYEVRDIQELVGRLVDEGIAAARRIGVTGDSYGGGQSLMLAALRDRVMLPDGRLVPWRTPNGRRLRLAAAAPVIPWSDLVTAAAPNGRVFAHAITPRSLATSPVGVPKATFVNGIFAAAQFATGPGQPVGEPFVPGRPMGFLAPPGLDPEADVTSWVARIDRGEPYTDAAAQEIVDLAADYHSAYYVRPTRPPPPLLLASGFTDDLFPVDEVLRFANRTRARFPDVPVSLLLGDFGHQRAANKETERDRLVRRIRSWFDRHLRAAPRPARSGVTAFTQTCPRSARPGGPFHARAFGRLARGEVRTGNAEPQALDSSGGDPEVGAAIDPVTGGGNGCVETPAAQAPGTAVHELALSRRGVTAVGAPTVLARVDVVGAEPRDAQIAARLWDVARGGQTQRLVARGTYRPGAEGSRQAWQLHPAAYRFRRGHAIRLELTGNDVPYARASNPPFEITISDLELRLPVRERPDCRTIRRAAPPVLLPGQRLAPGYGRRPRPACALG
jgi:hypothetical protein